MNRGRATHIAASTHFICSALAGYADQFVNFTYVECDTAIEITDYPDNARGDVIILSEIILKPVTSVGFEAFCKSPAFNATGDGS